MNAMTTEYNHIKQAVGVNLIAYMDIDGIHVDTYIGDAKVTSCIFSIQALAQNFSERRSHPQSNKIDDEEGIEEAYQMMNVLMAAQDHIGESIDDPEGTFVPK